MKIYIKMFADWIISLANKYPVFTRVLTQVIVFITTFGWHNSSTFWHIICIASLAVMSVLNISDAKLRKGTIEKSDQVVDILQGAIVDMVTDGAVEIGDFSISQPEVEQILEATMQGEEVEKTDEETKGDTDEEEISTIDDDTNEEENSDNL